jgi:hypothetical protein
VSGTLLVLAPFAFGLAIGDGVSDVINGEGPGVVVGFVSFAVGLVGIVAWFSETYPFRGDVP